MYGLHACMALFTKRPQDIIRVYCDDTHLKTLGPLLKWCASQKKAYHVVSEQEMERVTQSIHHEGVCILALEQAAPTFQELLEKLKSKNGSVCLIYLDDVQNPHNLGSILRVCAHFGAAYILGDNNKLPRLSASSYRIAKGGAEQVQVIALQHPKRAIHQLKEAGFALVASSSHQGESLYRYTFPARTLLAFGSEGTGLSPAILGEADATLQIPGSGNVESLNVAIAAALCIGEYWRQQQ